ncbi:hypothetical protein [Butyrivibrio sp. AE2032]|jgi:hypothetical protein|uniref:hypothetical protein n=1 Tax=Butyrivibrio sp. AE2032 TaxID=1458463 RepID=UPI000AAF9B16|nr:hypothetical protein [Butyrivibrio sp. AE2032]
MEVTSTVHVTEEEVIYEGQEESALFTDNVSEQKIVPEISKKSTVAFTERERLWEGMK